MSIIRAQGCVSRIATDIENDLLKTSTKGLNWKVDKTNDLVSVVAKLKVVNRVNSFDESVMENKWLAVNIVFPGITVNAYQNAPLLLFPHCSFFMKSGVDVKAALSASSEELPDCFWNINQPWFDLHQFIDCLFGYKEHRGNGKSAVVKRGEAAQMHYRPTRLFNVSEVGWLTDKVIDFIRIWCDV